ncbi:hypothetical protein H2201_006609 [Coniosporium apollinis]|uniref:Uncharacterized protein n=1 Tax=Coniosporium apollinis TaxID=61459 RepID=A0ABQ9NLG7_9PEZI|nr:hypothetical protein H2201_006609 [Coniosporium apollinis]
MTYGNSNNKESFAARQRRAGLPRHNSHQQSAGNDYAYHAYMERHYALAMRKPLEGPPASQRTAEPRVRDSVIDFTQASHFMGQAPEHHPGAQSSEKPSGPRIRDSVLDFAQVNHFMGFAPGFTPAEEKSEDESLYSSTAPSGSSFAPGHPQRSLSPLARAVRPFDSTVKVAPNIRVSGIDSDFDEWGNRRCTQPAPGHEKAHVRFKALARPQTPAPRPARPAPSTTQPTNAPVYSLFPLVRPTPARPPPPSRAAQTTGPQPSRRPVPNVDPQGYSRSVPTGFSDIFSERELREAEERHRAKKEKGFFRSLFGGKKKK